MAVTMVVEDGTGKADANSYLDLVDAAAYWDNRNNPAWAALADDDVRMAALIEATQYVEAYYVWSTGDIWSYDQALGWPRVNAEDRYGRYIDSDIIPQQVKDAVAELAYKTAVDGVELLEDTTTPPIEEAEVSGAVRVKYGLKYASTVGTTFPIVDKLLTGLAGTSESQGTVVRG